MAEIPGHKMWEWWRELANKELSLESQYKPLIDDHQKIHNQRMALEHLLTTTQGNIAEVSKQISSEWEKITKGEALPPTERRPMDVVYEILVRNQKPMHYTEILSELGKSGVIIGGQDPRSTLLAYLGRDKRFAKAPEVKRGVWKLKVE